jgi:hypothetical protein
MASVVHIHERDWAAVNVQVRQGNSPVAENNPLSGTYRLSLDQTHDVFGDVDVWWRRDRDPDNPDGTWYVWNHVVVYGPPAAPQDITEQVG